MYFILNIIVGEIAPTELKGQLGALHQVMVTLGIMVPGFMGLLVPRFIPPKHDNDPFCLYDNITYCQPQGSEGFLTLNFWRVFFGLPIAFAFIQAFCFLTVFAYDTPKFYKQRGEDAKLNEVMGKIYQADRVRERIESIQIEAGGADKDNSPSYRDVVCHPKYATASMVGFILAAVQQLSGINAIMFYSGNIISGIGIDYRIGTCLTNFVNWISTIGALFLLGSKVITLFNCCRIWKKTNALDTVLRNGSSTHFTWHYLLLCRYYSSNRNLCWILMLSLDLAICHVLRVLSRTYPLGLHG